MRKFGLLFGLILTCSVGCGSDGGGGGGVDAPSAQADAPQAGEPCDFMDPRAVAVDETVTADLPTCSSHFYSFTPPTTGVYTLVKSGGATLGFCDMAQGGCICANGNNCCSGCTLTVDLSNGDPLQAGVAIEIWVQDFGADPTPYTFVITGPN